MQFGALMARIIELRIDRFDLEKPVRRRAEEFQNVLGRTRFAIEPALEMPGLKKYGHSVVNGGHVGVGTRRQYGHGLKFAAVGAEPMLPDTGKSHGFLALVADEMGDLGAWISSPFVKAVRRH